MTFSVDLALPVGAYEFPALHFHLSPWWSSPGVGVRDAAPFRDSSMISSLTKAGMQSPAHQRRAARRSLPGCPCAGGYKIRPERRTSPGRQAQQAEALLASSPWRSGADDQVLIHGIPDWVPSVLRAQLDDREHLSRNADQLQRCSRDTPVPGYLFEIGIHDGRSAQGDRMAVALHLLVMCTTRR